jgi:hypothetical protein
MKARIPRWAQTAALLGLALLAGGQLAQARSSDRDHTRKIRYLVIQVRESDGTYLFEVIDAEKFREREKKAMEDFQEAAKNWLAEQKEAKKRGEKFDEPKPQPPLVKKFGSSFKEKEDAEAYRQKLEEAWEKKMAAKKKGEEADDEKEKPKKEDDNDEKEKPKEKVKPKEKAKEKGKEAEEEKEEVKPEKEEKEK